MRPIMLGHVRTDLAGFGAIGRISSHLDRVSQGEVIIDASASNWFDANMIAPLAAVMEKARNKGVEARLSNFHPRVAEILSRNGYLSPSTEDVRGTTVRFQRFGKNDAVSFAEYTETNIRKQGFPTMSGQAMKAFLTGLDEIFSNAALHSKTTGSVFACGQAFPRVDRLRFTVADAGVGIQATVAEIAGANISCSEAIRIAMKEGFTSKSLDVPGGLGLKVLKEFTRLNGGSLTVVSGSGYMSISGETVVCREYMYRYPGTVVTIEVNTADNSIYVLDGEIDPDTLF